MIFFSLFIFLFFPWVVFFCWCWDFCLLKKKRTFYYIRETFLKICIPLCSRNSFVDLQVMNHLSNFKRDCSGTINYIKYVLLWKVCCRLLNSIEMTGKRPRFSYVTNHKQYVQCMFLQMKGIKWCKYRLCKFYTVNIFSTWQ